MKKLGLWSVLLTLTLALSGCATTVAAGGSDSSPGANESTAPKRVAVQFRVNGDVTASGVDAYVADGQLYVPIGKVGYTTDRFVKWDKEKGEVVIQHQPSVGRMPALAGSAAATDKIKAALELLQQKDPEDYQAVLGNVQLIVPGKYNEAFPEANTVALSLDAPGDSVVWVASRLAHEAEHLRIAHTDPVLWKNAKENEGSAFRVSLEALKRLGGSAAEIAQEEKWVQDPPTWESVIK
ncbi:MAG: hypothetical protein ACYC5Y_05305 [Symbiobacteriia bacterium]